MALEFEEYDAELDELAGLLGAGRQGESKAPTPTYAGVGDLECGGVIGLDRPGDHLPGE